MSFFTSAVFNIFTAENLTHIHKYKLLKTLYILTGPEYYNLIVFVYTKWHIIQSQYVSFGYKAMIPFIKFPLLMYYLHYITQYLD